MSRRRRRRASPERVDSGRWCKDCLELSERPSLESERQPGVEYRPARRRATPFPGPRCKTHHDEVNKSKSDSRKASYLEENYDITEEEYQEILRAQGGVCYICHMKPGRYKRLSVDHCHALAKLHDHPVDKGCKKCIRGLLHSKCNSYLGWTRDDPEAWLRGAEYLRNPPARKVLQVT